MDEPLGTARRRLAHNTFRKSKLHTPAEVVMAHLPAAISAHHRCIDGERQRPSAHASATALVRASIQQSTTQGRLARQRA